MICAKSWGFAKFSSVEHPQTNGQVEAVNKIILQGLKKKVGKAKAQWVEVLPKIVRSYHMTVQSTTKEMPFSLVYGTDVVLPIEIKIQFKKVGYFEEQESAEGRLFELDTIEELRDTSRMED
ncbi:uncharacterized protein [Phaseolus vulgaris]|uniref:uncharacterized protein n=1 Tax=Phaseolus vulgaris TaxID=3885 RepID=UPI0035CB71EF